MPNPNAALDERGGMKRLPHTATVRRMPMILRRAGSRAPGRSLAQNPNRMPSSSLRGLSTVVGLPKKGDVMTPLYPM
jgi:hypothetical protein